MAIKLFDIKNGRIDATEHCYAIEDLKKIMDEYPDEWGKIYAYLFYMSCLNDEENPFVNTKEDEKEELILRSVGGDFSVDDPAISKARDLCMELYQTTTGRFYKAAKIGVEKVSKYLEQSQIIDGRDGNANNYMKYLERFHEVCLSFKAREREFKEEQSTVSRGGHEIPYDQK